MAHGSCMRAFQAHLGQDGDLRHVRIRGAMAEGYTTLMYTAGLSAWLDVLRDRKCEYSSHEKVAGGLKTTSGWNSNEAAAYPTDFNNYLAQLGCGRAGQPASPHPSIARVGTRGRRKVWRRRSRTARVQADRGKGFHIPSAT